MEFTYTARKITYKGKIIQAYEIGTGEKVIFSLPSFPHSGLYYAFFLQHFDLKKVKLITFDLPGWIGWSETFKRTEIPETDIVDFYANVAAEVLKTYKVSSFSLIGYSFGAAIAVKLASKMPQRINKIALVSGIYEESQLKNEPQTKAIKLLRRLSLPILLKVMIIYRFQLYKSALEEFIKSILLEQYSTMVNRADAGILLDTAYELFTRGINGGIEILQAFPEVLVVNSTTEDRFFRKQSEWLRLQLKNNINLKITGRHEDFVLRPKAEVVKKVVNYLLG